MWQDLLAWFQSPGGARVLQTAIVPALAILVAALLAAAIARSAVRSLLRRADRDAASAAVGALVAAGRLATPGAERGEQRRAGRMRAEADVRLRMLPLPGAALAADWASARLDALQQDDRGGAGVDDLRDRLVAWSARPARAKRLFPPTPAPERAAQAPAPSVAAPAAAPATEPPAVQQAAVQPVRPEEPATAPAAAEPSPEPAPPAPQHPDHEPATAVAAGAGAGAVPAWQRTRAGERLQQEHGRQRVPEAPVEREPEPVAAPAVPAPRVAPAAAAVPAASEDREESLRLEAHQQARHARAAEEPPAETGAVVAPPGGPAPAWLDTYDDEAQVTQNLDLKTPPPIAASAVRDRGGPGEDLVPRS